MPPEQETAITTKAPNVIMTSQGFQPKTMEEAWSIANRMARSQFVPEKYRNADDCFIALDISARLGCHVMMYLQNSYIVHGRPALESKLIKALVNQSGLFEDVLEYEIEGNDPWAKDYRVRAFAKRKSTGTVLYGPWISWKLVSGEKWDAPSKLGPSKWTTMPEMMFGYRADAWFCNKHCPEVKMGMMSSDEANETEMRRVVESKTIPTDRGGSHSFGKKKAEKEPAHKEDAPAKDVAKETVVTEEGPGTEAQGEHFGDNPTGPVEEQEEALDPDNVPDFDAIEAEEAEEAEASEPETHQYVCINEKCKAKGVVTSDVMAKKVRGKDVVLCKSCIGKMQAVPNDK